jgi:hypothetical protein
MANRTERRSWQNDWKDDGEDRLLSAKPLVTEAASEDLARSASVMRDWCRGLLNKDPDSFQNSPVNNLVYLFPAKANLKKILN